MKELLFTIPYKAFDIWAVKRYTQKVLDSQYPIDALGKHIVLASEKLVLFDYPEKLFSILGISNEIGMYDAYEKQGKAFNQSYKVVEDGYIAYNPYRINVGSIGIKTDALKGNLISPAYVVFRCKETLLPEFLFLLMKTEAFNKQVIVSTSGSVRQSLTFNALSKIRVPIPPIEIQELLVENYAKTIEKANEAREQCSWSLIDDMLNDFLHIETAAKNDVNKSLLRNACYSSLFAWDVKNRPSSNLFNTKKYTSVALASLATLNPTITKCLGKDTTISFIPMECVSDFDGTIIEYRECASDKKGFTKFEDGDIIWAKITPCMQNGKSAIVENMKNGVGYGSTEFYVIRRTSDKVLTEYLYYILRTERVRHEAVYSFTGSAGQQRVKKSFLLELQIPLPSMQAQEEIVLRLNNKKREIAEKKKEYESLLQQAKHIFQSAIFIRQD